MSTGYILGFDIYTAHDETSVSKFSKPLDPETTKTTQIVMGLLEKFKLLDKGHNLYMDNYYSSPELFEELYYRQTYACGTTHSIRKGMPSMISKMDVKPLQSLFVQNGPLLCLKWKGAKTKTKKKPVTILSTIHDAMEILTKKKDSHGNRLPKPESIMQYTLHMSGVDLSDQYMAFHMSLRKSMKWWRKVFFHILNMILLNAYILNNKYGKQKLSHDEYMEYIAEYLLDKGIEGSTCIPQKTNRCNTDKSQLLGRHFMQKIPKDPSCK